MVNATTNSVIESTKNLVTADSVIKHADAVDWLAAQEPGSATAVIYDPPYAVGTPVRGREDGAPGRCSSRSASCTRP